MAKPFVKMAGGKRKLAERITELLLPNGEPLAEEARYYEPFLGGGAVFFHLVEAGKIKSHQAVLTDVNAGLINAYREVRDHVDSLVAVLRFEQHSHSEERYYKMREEFNRQETGSNLRRAVLFIYLNKTCFNGLYRVNKSGEFNVPYGKYANPTICDADGLRAASAALQGARIEKASFYEVFEQGIREQDVIYADPPYVEIVEGGFQSYTKDGFTEKNQRDLEWWAGFQHRTVLSNHDTPEIRDWYKDPHWTIETIQVARPINRDGGKRGKVAEVLIYGGGAP